MTKMLPDDCLTKDRYGCDTITVSKEHLKDFPSLVNFMRQKGYGASTGVLKLRLQSEDREDTRLMNDLAEILKRKFVEKVSIGTRSKKVFAFNPQVQYFFKASVQDHIYQYSADFCTTKERKQFVSEANEAALIKNEMSECCKEALERGGLDTIRMHSFEEIEKSTSFTPELLQKLENYHDLIGTQNSATPRHTSHGPPLIYGAGVNVDVPLIITGDFSMSNLNTVIDLLPEKHDGIATPYAYYGTTHTRFPWHIEDGGLFSINYVISGAPKLWFVFPPECFGTIDCISQSFNMTRGHNSCRALLGDHKVLVADPHYFQKTYGIPYTTIVQEPGDFVIVYPFALHSGMNLGRNFALASNFGDEDWIEEGIYAPICSCNPRQVHLDLSPILKQYKPELLEIYLNSSGSMFPPTHPREIRRFPITSSEPKHVTSSRKERSSNVKVDKTKEHSQKQGHTGFKFRKLRCTECDASYEENKMSRLEDHVKIHHSQDAKHVLRLIKKKYPPWEPKTKNGFVCRVCGVFRRGSISQLKEHHRKLHQDLSFNGGIKCTK